MTNYFEAKPQRAVRLSEFSGAVVPKGTSQEVLDVLAANGIEVLNYNNAQEGSKLKAVEKLARALDKKQGDVLFSQRVKPVGAAAFNNEVDAAIASGMKGEAPGRKPVSIGRASAALEAAGLPAGELVTSPVILAKALFDHGVTKPVLKLIPSLLENPVMVFDSSTVNGSFVVVTSVLVNSKPLLIIVTPNETRGSKTFNFVPSVYPKDETAVIQKWLNTGKLRYLDKKQSPQWFVSTRLQLPGEYRTSKGLQAKNITTNEDVVKPLENPDILKSFAGPKAKTADRLNLLSAQRQIAEGADTETVRQETGWHRGLDGRWRFEIADNQASIQPTATGTTFGSIHSNAQLEGMTVGDVLAHDQLYAAYPGLKRHCFAGGYKGLARPYLECVGIGNW